MSKYGYRVSGRKRGSFFLKRNTSYKPCPLLPAPWQGQLARCSYCEGKFPMELSSIFFAESVLTKSNLIRVLIANVLGGLQEGESLLYRKGVSHSTWICVMCLSLGTNHTLMSLSLEGQKACQSSLARHQGLLGTLQVTRKVLPWLLGPSPSMLCSGHYSVPSGYPL